MQQLRIDFETENNWLPLNYNSSVLTALRRALERHDAQTYQEWFGGPEHRGTGRGRLYTFSCSFPSPRFTNAGTILGGNAFSVYLSSWDADAVSRFHDAFVAESRESDGALSVCGAGLRVTNVAWLPIVPIVSSSVRIRFDSPMLVRRAGQGTGAERFIGHTHEAFAESTRLAVAESVAECALKLSLDDFGLAPVDAKKTYVRHGWKLRVGNLGEYELRGAPETLNFLMLVGLGSLAREGYGKFRVVR